MADIQGHTAVVLGHAPPDDKGLIESNQVRIAAEGLGEEVGLEDGFRYDAIGGFRRFSIEGFMVLCTSLSFHDRHFENAV